LALKDSLDAGRATRVVKATDHQLTLESKGKLLIVGKLLKRLGFSHMSARPRHPAQDERIVEGFKKTSRAR
jgi:hypothetical protein